MDVAELAHTNGEVGCGASICDFDLAPGTMGVKEDEQIDRAVSPALAIKTFKLSRHGRNWLAHFADQLGRALVEADHRTPGVRRLGIEIEDILHGGDIGGIDLYADAPGLGRRQGVVKRSRAVG